jgi:hypothetical protein
MPALTLPYIALLRVRDSSHWLRFCAPQRTSSAQAVSDELRNAGYRAFERVRSLALAASCTMTRCATRARRHTTRGLALHLKWHPCSDCTLSSCGHGDQKDLWSQHAFCHCPQVLLQSQFFSLHAREFLVLGARKSVLDSAQRYADLTLGQHYLNNPARCRFGGENLQ